MIIPSIARTVTELNVERKSVTTTENELVPADAAIEASETPAETPAVKYPTYVELAKATWKLAFRLSSRGDEDTSRDYCVGGTNEYLEALELPSLGNVEELEQADGYLDAWLKFTHWRATGELSPVDDRWLRNRLVTRMRNTLQRKEPADRDVMNGWLAELGLEPFPAPQHTGRYDVSHSANATVNSELITRALNALIPDANVRVSYVGRIH